MRKFVGVARAVTVASTAALVLVVMAVGAVAVYAEARKTWTWYFHMERAIETATPIVVGLVVVSLFAFFGFVLVARNDYPE